MGCWYEVSYINNLIFCDSVMTFEYHDVGTFPEPLATKRVPY